MTAILASVCGLLACVILAQALYCAKLRDELREWQDSIPFRGTVL